MANFKILFVCILAFVHLVVGQSEVPDARPPPSERLYNSSTIENVILDVSSRIGDPTIRQIFQNCLPSTLGKFILNINKDLSILFKISSDTTVLWTRSRSAEFPIPYTYIITGGIWKH